MNHYEFEVVGQTGDGQQYTAAGIVSGETQGNFVKACDAALRAAFRMLVDRSAATPAMCKGPYTISKLTIEHVKGTH